MDLDIKAPMSPRYCGNCGKTIRLREDMKVVLCTAILERVDADFEEVCEYYEERSCTESLPGRR